MAAAKRVVCDLCGGPKIVAQALGMHKANVYRWWMPEERGGTGGIIAAEAQARLLMWASETGHKLSPLDFWHGVFDARGRFVADGPENKQAA